MIKTPWYVKFAAGWLSAIVLIIAGYFIWNFPLHCAVIAFIAITFLSILIVGEYTKAL